MRRLHTERGRRGYTLLEAVLATAVLLTLATVAIPSAKHFVKRQKEMELRRALREIRGAIETYHRCAQIGLISPLDADPQKPWPKSLEELEEGVTGSGAWGGPRMKVRFIRRIPKDPFNMADEGFDDDSGWRLRSPQDSPDSNMWGRDRIFEVYSGSEARAVNGSYYKDW